MKKQIIVIMLILSMAIILFSGCTGRDVKGAESKEQEEQKSYTPVEVTQVARKTLANITMISGKVFADRDVMVLPKVPGTVKTMAVKDGDRVKEGDLLFTLDEKDIRKQVDQAKAAYDMAKANYNMNQEKAAIARDSLERTEALTESLLNNARENLENTRQLYEAGAVSKAQLEQAELALQQQEAQLQGQLDQAKMGASAQVMEVAKAQLKQAELAYQQAQEALNNASVTSPIDGVVTGVSIEVGGMASNAQPAMNIVDMERVYVRVDVVEGMVNQLKNGKEVSVTIPAATPTPFQGSIERVSPAADLRTQLYPVRIYLENKDGTIKPGMFSNVEIALNIREDVLAIPSQAVILKEGNRVVYVIEDGKGIEREVEVGLDTGTEVEIIKGLKEKETIIIKGQNYIEDGGTVKVVGGTEQ